MWSIVLLGIAAAQDSCQVEQDTASSYKPRAADMAWADAGGWSGKRLKGLSKERKKDFKRYKRQFAAYPADAQDDILAGVLREDLDEVAAWLAWGAPSWTWSDDEKRCRHLLYADRGANDVVLSTCDGKTDGLFELQAPIACERLDAVVPRVEKKARQAKEWTPEQMVAVLAGVPQTWMDRGTLELAFGKPDKKAEKGSRLTFLEDDGIHEGPTVVLVDGLASTWTFPQTATMTRSAARAQHREARQERLQEARRSVFQLLTTAAAVGMAAYEESGGSTTHSVEKSSYRNHVRLECNGTVLVDEVFTDRDACVQAEQRSGAECLGRRMPFGC